MKILCPFCLQHFDNAKAKFLCHNTGHRCNLSPTKEYVDYWNISEDSQAAQRPRVYNGGWSLFGPAKPRPCPSCGDTSADYVCPHCHNSLPYDMVKYGTDIIPIIGGPAVGKTCYMVALLEQLDKHGYKINLVSSLQSLYGDAADKFKEMRNTLFKYKQCLEKTAVREDGISAPWFVKIETKKGKRPTFLVFYDIAGEQFENAKVMRAQAAQLRYASGAIVLLDTLDLEAVKEARAKAGEYDAEEHFSIEETVQELFQLSNNDHVLQDAPIAFAFSKVDVIGRYSSDLGAFGASIDMKQNTLILNPRYTYNNLVGREDFNCFLDDCRVMHEGLMQGLGENDLGNLIKNNDWKEENICYFGVSALGQEPEEDFSINTPKIVPYRVLDPLLWILHRLGKLDIPK